MRAMCWLVLILVSGIVGCAGEDVPIRRGLPPDPKRHQEPAGKFSYIPPTGWNPVDSSKFPGLKYKAFAGPPANGFAPNTNVLDSGSWSGVDAWVDASIANSKEKMQDAKLISKDPFATSDGLKGVRFIMEFSDRGRTLRTVQYAFGRGSKKYLLTGTVLKSSGELDATFDEVAKSFGFEE